MIRNFLFTTSYAAILNAVVSINLSASSILETATSGSTVGSLSVNNGSGTYTFSITSDPDNKFVISGSNLNTDATLDYETATSHSVTVEADNGVDDVITRTISISVTNVLEITLGDLTLDNATVTTGSVEDTLVGEITGGSAGSTYTLIDDGEGQFKLVGTEIYTTDTATDIGTDATPYITIRETNADGSNSPKDNVIEITVSNTFDLTTLDSALLYWRADNPDNVLETHTENFDPADVNTTDDYISLSMTGFTRSSERNYGVFYFSTTGVLPAPFLEDTPYIGDNNGDGTYSFYPYNEKTDYASFPDFQSVETIFPGDSYAFDRNKIAITTQGTGVHTITTNPLYSDIIDLVSGNNLFTASSPETMFEKLTDEIGDYIYLTGSTVNAGEPQGKSMFSSMSTTTLGTLFAGHRYLYSVFVGEPMEDHFLSINRYILNSARITAGTGVFNNNNHYLVTEEEVTVGAISDNGAFPTPDTPFAANIYARKIDNNNFTLHPTALDATNNTNVYTYSDTGVGSFYVAGSINVNSGSSHRKMVFDVSILSNDHAFTPTFVDGKGTMELGSGSYFMPSGFGNGNLNFIFGASGYFSPSTDILRVTILIPPGAVAPVVTDGLPFESGDYYMTLQTVGSNWRRLHRTLAGAQACVGLSTNACSSTDVMKYGTLGSGTAMVYIRDRYFYQQFDDGFNRGSSLKMGTYGEEGIYIHMVDYNSGGGKWLYYNGKDTLWNLVDGVTSSRNSPLPNNTQASITLDNTGQPHVPFKGKVRAVFVGGSNTDPTADIETVIANL